MVIDACAFSVWNLASRSPAQLLRDLAAGLRRPGSAASGITRAIGGLLLLAAGAVVLLPLVLSSHTYIVLETWAVLTGLLVEQVIGTSFRSGER
jgi:hypothetical protein